MDSLKDVIIAVIENLQTKAKTREVEDSHLEAYLKKSLSKKELGHTKYQYFRKGILGINVDSSAWLYHLTLGKDKLLAKLREQSGIIKDVRFYLGEIQ